MEKAKAMLADGLQVQEIAASLGYEDRPYFSELFKKHTGLTPTEYRNKKVISSSLHSRNVLLPSRGFRPIIESVAGRPSG
ncbi:helix-turn-helix domain-containing protein [Cohnella ginsengisoli]|uniref:helix-turn-helix domain-containing protein n=1 Tax=Cohnella ginsengisoli TaxID=425004 RepID=UPI003B8A69C0